MSDCLAYETDARGVAVLTLARPEKRNALSLAMLVEALNVVKALPNDASTRVLLLRGLGASFCAGMDLGEAASAEPIDPSRRASIGIELPNDAVERGRVMPRLVQELIKRLRFLPQIVVGRAQGTSCGGGVGLLTGCDVVDASEDFNALFTETRRGFSPALLFPFLYRKYPIARLQEAILAARPIDASTAKEMGLVSRVVPRERLDQEVENTIENLLRNDPVAMAAGKKIFAEATTPNDEEIERAWNEHWRAFNSERGREGIAAFLQKRAPSWDRTTN